MEYFEYFAPTTLSEALMLLRRYSGRASVLGGGTDLFVSMKKREKSPEYVVNLKRIPGLDYVSFSETDGLRIGTLTTLQSITQYINSSPLLQDRCGPLANACKKVGTPQIRNMGTAGGNLCLETRCKSSRDGSDKCFKRGGNLCHVVKGGDRCYAVMASDLSTILIALDSKVMIAGQIERLIPLEDLYTGEGKRAIRLEPDEVLTEIRVPPQELHSQAPFLKFRWRESLDFPIVNSAARVLRDHTLGTCKEVRIVLGTLTSAPIRLKKTEAFLKNRMLSDQVIEESVYEGMRGIPIVSCSGIPVDYLRKMGRTFAVKAIKEAYETSHRDVEGGNLP